MKTFASEIKRLREREGISREVLSAHLDVSECMIYRYECVGVIPNPIAFCDLKVALNLTEQEHLNLAALVFEEKFGNRKVNRNDAMKQIARLLIIKRFIAGYTTVELSFKMGYKTQRQVHSYEKNVPPNDKFVNTLHDLGVLNDKDVVELNRLREEHLRETKNYNHKRVSDGYDVSTLLKQCRIAAGLTVHQVTDTLGVSAYVISRWENGMATPSIDSLLGYHLFLRDIDKPVQAKVMENIIKKHVGKTRAKLLIDILSKM